MTIEEMVEVLESGYTAHATAQIIISALRAGQEMKGVGNGLANYLDRLICSNPPDRPSYEEALRLLVKWDAATKEES